MRLELEQKKSSLIVMSTGSGLLRASVGGRAAPLYMQVAVLRVEKARV
jgi:hypothetical protein